MGLRLRAVPLAFVATTVFVVLTALALSRARFDSTAKPGVATACPTATRTGGTPTPTPSRFAAAPPGTPDRPGLAPTPVRVVDTAPGMPRRDETEIFIQRPDCAIEAYFVDPAKANAIIRQLPPGDRLVAVAPPQSAMEQQVAPAPTAVAHVQSKLSASGGFADATPSVPPTPTVPSSPVASPVIPTYPTWSPGAIADGLTLTLDPDHARGGAIRVSGSVAPSLRHGTLLTLAFLPGSAHRSLGDKAHTAYRGGVWPAVWTLHLDAHGHFDQMIKLPSVILAPNGEIWQILPGDHSFAVVLDADHVARAAFHQDPPPPPPNATPMPEVTFRDAWLLDARTGWLLAQRCSNPLPPTPDANANVGPLPPPLCQGLIERTTDGGQTWTEQALDGLVPRSIQFVDSQHGWIAATTHPYCDGSPCETVILRTVDGGERWERIYQTDPNSPRLPLNGHGVPARSTELTTLAFTSDHDGWVFGRACPGTGDADCQPVLLATHDGINFDRPASLPGDLVGYRTYSLAHPTTSDGWLVTGSREQGSTIEPGRLLATHDGGQTWQEQPDPLDRLLVQGAFFLDARHGWLIGGSQPATIEQAKELDGTTDAGATWTRISVSGPAVGLPRQGHVALPAGTFEFVSADEGWLALERTGLWHTTDGGRSWASIPVGQPDALEAVHFASARDGWVVGLRELEATTDGGATWSPIALA